MDADFVGELAVGGIPHNQLPAAGDYRRVGFGHPELLEQAGQRRSSGQEGDIPGELAAVIENDRLRLVARVVDDLHPTRLHDEELEVAFAYGIERLSVLVGVNHPLGALAELSELRVGERREG